MTDSTLKLALGKLAPKYDPRTLIAGTYISNVPVPPSAVAFPSDPTDWGMLLNDGIGDCTVAGQAHTSMLWTDLAQRPDNFSDKTVLHAYEKLTGYDPSQTDAQGNNPTDTGAYLTDALAQWRKSGIGGHKVHAYAALDVHDVVQVQQAVWLTNTAYIGIALPVTVQDQVRNGQVWDVVPNSGAAGHPGSWGGHCVCLAGYDQRGPYFISWGKIYQMSWRFWSAYVDEAYLVIGADQLEKTKKDPKGFAMGQLQADLDAITKGSPQN